MFCDHDRCQQKLDALWSHSKVFSYNFTRKSRCYHLVGPKAQAAACSEVPPSYVFLEAIGSCTLKIRYFLQDLQWRPFGIKLPRASWSALEFSYPNCSYKHNQNPNLIPVFPCRHLACWLVTKSPSRMPSSKPVWVELGPKVHAGPWDPDLNRFSVGLRELKSQLLLACLAILKASLQVLLLTEGGQ